MYPAYKLSEALDMYAVSFFTLLNEGYRLRYKEYRLFAQIGILTIMKDRDRSSFLRDLEQAGTDFSDILKPSGQGSTPEELKRLLGG